MLLRQRQVAMKLVARASCRKRNRCSRRPRACTTSDLGLKYQPGPGFFQAQMNGRHAGRCWCDAGTGLCAHVRLAGSLQTEISYLMTTHAGPTDRASHNPWNATVLRRARCVVASGQP